MFEFSLRKSVREDSSAIRKLVISANLNPTGLDWGRFVVAQSSSGQVIGCVQIKPHRDGSQELASLVVVEDWKGKGVARALIEDAIENHDGWLYLMCRSGLGELYQRFGFEVLDHDAMPLYFQRVSKLARGFHQLTKIGEGLLVMGRDCGKIQG
jgi:N-acetylglutamate synthase-like GNAT family acetyltransferase